MVLLEGVYCDAFCDYSLEVVEAMPAFCVEYVHMYLYADVCDMLWKPGGRCCIVKHIATTC